MGMKIKTGSLLLWYKKESVSECKKESVPEFKKEYVSESKNQANLIAVGTGRGESGSCLISSLLIPLLFNDSKGPTPLEDGLLLQSFTLGLFAFEL